MGLLSLAAMGLPCSPRFCRRFCTRLQTLRQDFSLPRQLFALLEGAALVRAFPNRPCAGISTVGWQQRTVVTLLSLLRLWRQRPVLLSTRLPS